MGRNQMPPRRNPTSQKMMPTQLDRIEQNQKLILAGQEQTRAMLAALLDSLADEGDEPQFDLDGNLIENFERDDNESLD